MEPRDRIARLAVFFRCHAWVASWTTMWAALMILYILATSR